MSQREEAIEKQWAKVEAYLYRLNQEVFNRLIPFFTTTKNHPFLKQLYPFTGHEFLYFCHDITSPWSENYPCIGPIPNMCEYGFLMMVREVSDFENSISWFQRFFDRYEFLLEQHQPYVIVDKNNTIIELSNPVDGVNWILEQTREMYTVFIDNNTATDLQEPQILGIVDIQGAIDLLVKRINSINPGFYFLS
jgi:hypothetical protein